MRKGLLRLSLLSLALASACADNYSSHQAPSAIGGDGSRIYRAAAGTTLTTPSNATADAVVRDFLQDYASDAVTQMSLVSQTPSVNGVSHVRFEQHIGDLRVFNAYVKAALTDKGELVQVIENLAPAGALSRATSVTHKDALAVAMKELGYDFATPAEKSANGQTLTFDRGTEFWRDPTVERLAYQDPETGLMKVGYLVMTWAGRANQLNYSLVSGNGRLLSTELRTANDAYNVFTVDPVTTPQSVQSGQPNWLGTGAQTTTNISGNNAHSYLDKDANNAPDPGGTAVTDGNFLSALEDAAPDSTTNTNVAVQNLHFLNNVIHDILYSHGFTEAAGNFQNDNFGLGGLDADAVNAEAQDGSGTDNANFSTPNDGQPGRMQMYLWTGRAPNALVYVDSATQYGGYQSSFGTQLTLAGTATTPLALVNDGTGTTTDGCEAMSGLSGKIAIVDRGTCNFTVKVLNAQKAGAVGVIIVNNATSRAFSAGGTERRIRIPSVMVELADRAAIVGTAAASLRKNPVTPRMVDGDLDSGVVYHEYGHGLTWRMIGSMSGPLAGALGEGASDVNAFLVNDDPIMGAYAYSDPLGIRRAPYDNYTLTYADVDGGEVHNDGEIYAAAMWRVKANYNAAGLTNADLHDDFVKGMDFTPSSPTFENMRDGLLAQARLSGRECLVWRGFASIGLGAGSSATVSHRGIVTTTPSSALGDGCTP